MFTAQPQNRAVAALLVLLVLSAAADSASNAFGSKLQWSEARLTCSGVAQTEEVLTHPIGTCERDTPYSSHRTLCTASGGYTRTNYPSSPDCSGWWMKEFVATNRCFVDRVPTVQLCPGTYSVENFQSLEKATIVADPSHTKVSSAAECGAESGRLCQGPRLNFYEESASCQGDPQSLVLYEGLTHAKCSFDTTSNSFVKASCDDYQSVMKVSHFNDGACQDPKGPYKSLELSYGFCRPIGVRQSVMYLCE